MLMWERWRAHVEQWLFGPIDPGNWRARLRRLAQYLYALLRDLLGGRLNIHANGLVFATVLALVPLIAFSFALLRGFGAQRELEPLVYEFFLPMGSAASELTEKVMSFADRVRSEIDLASVPVRAVVIDAAGMPDVDYTGALVFASLVTDLRKREIAVVVARANTDVRAALSSQIDDVPYLSNVEDAVRATAAIAPGTPRESPEGL